MTRNGVIYIIVITVRREPRGQINPDLKTKERKPTRAEAPKGQIHAQLWITVQATVGDNAVGK